MAAGFDYRDFLSSEVRNLSMDEAETVYHFVLGLEARALQPGSSSGFKTDCWGESEVAGQWVSLSSYLPT